MAIDVLMPKLSDTMEEGKILKWFKQPGEAVKIGDVLAEVETDKANMEIEAFDEGVLAELRTAEGDSAPVGAVIATLSEDGEEAPAKGESPKGESPKGESPKAEPTKTEAAKAAATADEPRRGSGSAGAEAERQVLESVQAPTERAADEGESGDGADTKDARDAETGASSGTPRRQPAATRSGAVTRSSGQRRGTERPAPPPDAEPERLRVSPLARRLASERGIDLAGIEGTGPDGRIVERDIEAAAKRGAAPAAPRRDTAKQEAAPAAPSAGTRVALGKIRATTAKRMAEAKRSVPHFYVSGEIAMEEALRLKDSLAALGGEWEGITVTHLLLKAVGLALARVPEMNASSDGDDVVLHAQANIGLATAVDAGLLVPVVRDCAGTPLRELVAAARGVVDRARRGKLSGDDLTGGTFTISNLGMFPVSEFAAVINPPQAAILAVGTVRDVPVVQDGQIVPGKRMTVTLSCDHRVVDGALAGRFLAALKPLLEQPVALVAA